MKKRGKGSLESMKTTAMTVKNERSHNREYPIEVQVIEAMSDGSGVTVTQSDIIMPGKSKTYYLYKYRTVFIREHINARPTKNTNA